MPRRRWAPGERERLQARAVKMREEGYYVTEINEELGIQKSTAYEWTKHVKVDPEVERKRHERHNRERATRLYISHMDNCDHVRRENYLQGKASEITDEDSYCIGQYGGEGQKARKNGIWSPNWLVVNADREFIRRMRDWAIRVGKAPDEFRAKVYVHEGVTPSEEEVKAYWAEAGIPVERIAVYKVENAEPRKSPSHILSWGTCHLEPVEDGVALFWYWCGQYDQLLENAGMQPEFLSLLNNLRDQEEERKEKYLSAPSQSSSNSTA